MDWPEKEDQFSRVKDQRKRVLTIALVLSLLFHLSSYINLDSLALRFHLDQKISSKPVSVKIVSKSKEEALSSKNDQLKKIVEVPLLKTEPPKEAKFSSFQDHMAEKQTRVESKTLDKGKSAGDKGKANDPQLAKKNDVAPPAENLAPKLEFGPGTMPVATKEEKKRREKYKSLLPKDKDLAGLVDAGYQQHLDEEIDLGDRIDINTSEYRYMGYFTGMRKAIELVWNYPMDAVQRNMQGEVTVEFVIYKTGLVSRIKVLKSSGYKILDDAIVEALKLASPFSPLPAGFGKEKMLVTGSFRYVLSPYVAGAH